MNVTAIAIPTSAHHVPDAEATNRSIALTNEQLPEDECQNDDKELDLKLGEDAFETGTTCNIEAIDEEENEVDVGEVSEVIDAGLREKTTTPASHFAELIKSDARMQERPSPGVRLDSASRDSMFQQAINLMTERCPSMALMRKETAPQTPLVVERSVPYGAQHPSYFYVTQTRPSPMEPLKAWRGYHGNVYFEPIHIGRAKYGMADNKGRRHSPMSPMTPSPAVTDDISLPNSRRNARSNFTSAKSSSSKSYVYKGKRQMSVLDKKSVFFEDNDRLEEDYVWVMGSEAVGSLRVQSVKPQTAPASSTRMSNNKIQQENKKSFEKDKIHKGSVVRRSLSSEGKVLPLLSVTGDKYTQSQLPSPLLRTQTQYSQSNQRMAINSPDLYHSFSNYDKLPPLEQLRASLRHMNNVSSQESQMVHVVPNTERLSSSPTLEQSRQNPLIKFGPGVSSNFTTSDRALTPVVKHNQMYRSKVK